MMLILSILLLFTLVTAKCPNNCFDRGICDSLARCICNEGFQGGDCSERICPFGVAWSDQATSTDTAHALAECSNRGTCNRVSGTCACMEGFTGKDCSLMTCPSNCNSFGRCMTLRNFAAQTRDANSKSFSYVNNWDANKVSGCVCDLKYGGYDCSLQLCPNGDDPLTLGQVNERQVLQCIAIAGSFVLYFKGYASLTIPFNANAKQVQDALSSIPLLSDVQVSFSIPSGQVCQTASNIIIFTFMQNFGPQSPLVAVPDNVMVAANGKIIVMADGLGGLTDSLGRSFSSIKGTKENDECSNRGVCSVTDGQCYCFATNGDVYDSSNGYGMVGTRGDCGFIKSGSSVSSCPGDVPCSSKGICNSVGKTFRCTCAIGWTGGDCSLRECPTGRSWFDYPIANDVAHTTLTECSDMGMCDRSSGTCSCRSGYFGQACEYMGCGGGTATPCFGHGKCMSMQQLAIWAEDNGDATDYTYGANPNNPKTWDGFRVHGCLCDEGYFGYDCSLRSCPTGADPLSTDKQNEVQILQCLADAGTFTLTFRQKTTRTISYTASVASVQQELQALKTISPLHVVVQRIASTANATLSGPLPLTTPFCNTNGGTYISVYFLRNPGRLPKLTADVTKLINTLPPATGLPGSGSVLVTAGGQYADPKTKFLQSIAGTSEVLPCSNRGLCDTSTGVCACFNGWSSSDGNKNIGDLPDCGYKLPEQTLVGRGMQ